MVESGVALALSSFGRQWGEITTTTGRSHSPQFHVDLPRDVKLVGCVDKANQDHARSPRWIMMRPRPIFALQSRRLTLQGFPRRCIPRRTPAPNPRDCL